MTDGALTRVEFTPERLERAKERLANVDVGRAAGRLRGVFAVSSPSASAGISAIRCHRASSGAPAEISDSFRDRILADNARRPRALRIRSGPGRRAIAGRELGARRCIPLWNRVIEPFLAASGARRVVEIGALQGETTVRLLDLLGPESEVHVIDPVPQFDPSEHERQFPGPLPLPSRHQPQRAARAAGGGRRPDRRRPQLVHGLQRARAARRRRPQGRGTAAAADHARRRLALRPPRPLLRARADPGGVPPALRAEGAAPARRPPGAWSARTRRLQLEDEQRGPRGRRRATG